MTFYIVTPIITAYWICTPEVMSKLIAKHKYVTYPPEQKMPELRSKEDIKRFVESRKLSKAKTEEVPEVKTAPSYFQRLKFW